MTVASPFPLLLVGCGRLGSAMVEGWLATGAVDARGLMIVTPSPKPVAETARAAGAQVNPSPEALSDVKTVVLAVKPARWRNASEPLIARLAPDAVIISVMAGVGEAALTQAFAGRPVARVMPTTGVAQGRGVAAIWSADAQARETAHALFDAVADTVDLDDEALMDPATAVAGSAPAFIHAFVRALAQAGVQQGLDAEAAVRLARGALRSAAAGEAAGEALEALIARVASPGGTTEAGLQAMSEPVERAAAAAVDAATARARELGG